MKREAPLPQEDCDQMRLTAQAAISGQGGFAQENLSDYYRSFGARIEAR